jgi:hypothetical protein
VEIVVGPSNVTVGHTSKGSEDADRLRVFPGNPNLTKNVG